MTNPGMTLCHESQPVKFQVIDPVTLLYTKGGTMYTASHTRHIVGALLALGFATATVPSHAVQKGD